MNIRKLNDKNFKSNEIDQLNLDAWEMFDFPNNLSQEETEFTVEFLSGIGVDVDDDYVITFNAQPHHIANIVVQILRLYKSRKNSKIL